MTAIETNTCGFCAGDISDMPGCEYCGEGCAEAARMTDVAEEGEEE